MIELGGRHGGDDGGIGIQLACGEVFGGQSGVGVFQMVNIRPLAAQIEPTLGQGLLVRDNLLDILTLDAGHYDEVLVNVNLEDLLDTIQIVGRSLDGFEHNAAVGVFERHEAVLGAAGGDRLEGVFGRDGVNDLTVNGRIAEEFAGGFFGK